MFHSFDAANPPLEAPPHCEAAIGYIGGAAERLWTDSDWRRFAHLRQLGIWVYDRQVPAGIQGRDAAKAAEQLGWAAHGLVPRAVVLDIEALVVPGAVDAFADELQAAGYATIVYGSASTIVSNPARAGRWVALWDGLLDMPRIENAVGHQYLASEPFGGGAVDLSVWDSSAWHRFGYGPRR
jgi:hypothetical protein